MTKQIPLTNGVFALVDDDVYEWANGYTWYAVVWGGSARYAIRSFGPRTARKTISLHREIMNAPKGVLVDHIDGDGLNCTRVNMRLASQSENQHNRGSQRNNQSGYKGVCWHKLARKWHARITVNGKTINLGIFDDKEDAARTYDEAARKYHGEFAKTNLRG